MQTAVKLRGLQTTINSLPLVAEAIAKANGVKVEFNGPPRTDGKIIYLPDPASLAAQLAKNGEETRTLLWGFLDHEAAHVRFTSFNALEKRVHKTADLTRMTNIVEDIRIESLMGGVFPGAALNLRSLTDLLVQREWFQATDASRPKLDRGSAYVLHHLRACVLGQKALEPLAAADRATLSDETLTALDPLLAWSGINTTDDAINLAQAILDVLHEPDPPTPQQNEAGSDAGTDPNAEPQAGDGESTPPASGDGSDSAKEADGQSQAGDDANAPPSDEGDPSDASGNGGAAGKESDPTASARGDKILEAGGDLGDVLGAILGALQTAETSEKPRRPHGWGDNPSHDGASQALQDPNRMRRLGKQLSTNLHDSVQTTTLARERRGLRGPVLDTRVLHRIGVGDGRVFRARTLVKRPDTAVVVCLDLSGSMVGCWDTAATAALSTLHGMATVRGVKVGLFAFPHGVWVARIGARLPASVRSGRMLQATGGTPTALALMACARELILCREPRKVVICVTDGGPNSPINKEVKVLKELGIETLGIGISAKFDLPFDRWIAIDQAEQLRSVLARTLRELTLH